MKNFIIKQVEHPTLGKDWQYPALYWEGKNYTTTINLYYAEETLKDYLRCKDLTNLEYLEAKLMVKEWNKQKCLKKIK